MHTTRLLHDYFIMISLLFHYLEAILPECGSALFRVCAAQDLGLEGHYGEDGYGGELHGPEQSYPCYQQEDDEEDC